MSHLINFILLVAVFVMIGIIIKTESSYLFSKPTCSSCSGNLYDNTITSLKKQTKKVLNMTKQLTKEIKQKITHEKEPDADFVKPVEHINSYKSVVKGSNEMNNQIDETLPFSDFTPVDDIEVRTIEGMIEGPVPPAYADPRVMNPSLSAAPVQFSDPAEFGTFGVTDDVSPVFTNTAILPKTDAKLTSDASLEGFELEGGLVKDGKIVTKECELPSYQLKGYEHHTTIPIRSLKEPPAQVEDIIEEGMFDGLQGYPIDEKGAELVPPGIATPGSEWAAIFYGRPN